MRKSRFTEAQIIGMIKEQEAGLPTSELCRKHGLSPATFYKLKAKYGGMDLSDAKRLKQLEDENAKLKRLLADAMLDNVVLQSLPWGCIYCNDHGSQCCSGDDQKVLRENGLTTARSGRGNRHHSNARGRGTLHDLPHLAGKPDRRTRRPPGFRGAKAGRRDAVPL